MVIYPAIDLIDGKCVRLSQGQYDDVTVYSENPLEVAQSFKDSGATFIHMVDLDGARGGKGKNKNVILQVAKQTGLMVQTGGGIRDLETIDFYLSGGIKRVILGTSAVKNRDLVVKAVDKYGDAIAVGIDAKDGKVAIEGWEQTSDFRAIDFAKDMESIGVKNIIYTDISRDGMLSGPNISAMRDMAQSVNINVIASGGVSKLADMQALKETGVNGVIVGKAIYVGNIDLKEAISSVL